MNLKFDKENDMANKKISITFQSSGIDDIIKQLDGLKEKASKIILSQELDDQIANLSESARNVKEAIEEVQEALKETNNKKQDNKTLTSMERKMKELEDRVKTISNSFATISASIDKSSEKINSAIERINREDALSGLINQMKIVDQMFADLTEKARGFKNTVYERGNTPLVSAAKRVSDSSEATAEPKRRGRPKGIDYDADKIIQQLTDLKNKAKQKEESIEIKKDLTSDEYVSLVKELATEFSETLKDRNALVERIEELVAKSKTMTQGTQEYEELRSEFRTLRSEQMAAERKLLELGKTYDTYVNKISEYENDQYNLRIADMEQFDEAFKAISDLNVNEFSEWTNFNHKKERGWDYEEILKNAQKEYVRGLSSAIEQRKKELQEIADSQKEPEPEVKESIAQAVNKIIDENVEDGKKRGRPPKKIELGLTIQPGAKEEAIQELNAVIEEIQAKNPHIDLNVNVVSDYIMKNRESLVSQLNKQIENIDDPEIKEKLQELVPKIDKTFKGDVKLNIATNIEEIAKDVPRAVNVIKREVAGTPIDLNLKVNRQDIVDQIEEMGKLSIPIGEITLSKNLYKNIVNEADKEAEAAIEAQKKQQEQELKEAEKAGKNTKALTVKAAKELEKATKESKESIGVVLNDTIANFLKNVEKLPTIIKGIYNELDTIPIKLNAEFDQEQVNSALKELSGLSVKVDKIDASQAVLNKLKFDVKGGLEELIPVGKSLVVEVMRLCNLLAPFQHQIKAIASDSQEDINKVQQGLPVNQDVSRYIRDALQVLINIVGNIETSLHKLDELKVQIQPIESEQQEDKPSQVTIENSGQLNELIDVTSAIVRAIYLLNKQLIPLHNLQKITESVDDIASNKITRVGDKQESLPVSSEEQTDSIKNSIEEIKSTIREYKESDEANAKDSKQEADTVQKLNDISSSVQDIITRLDAIIKVNENETDAITKDDSESEIMNGIGAIIRTMRIAERQLSGISVQLSTITGAVKNGTVIQPNINPSADTTKEQTIEIPGMAKVKNKWFTKFDNAKVSREGAYQEMLEKDLAIFKKEAPLDDLSDLEQLQVFYNEYLEYLAEAIENATKKNKPALQKYRKYVQNQKKANDKASTDVMKYAQQQADEYAQENKKYNEERRKSLAKGEEQRRQEIKKADNEALAYANKQADEYARSNGEYVKERVESLRKGEEQRKQAQKEYEEETKKYAQKQAQEYAQENKKYNEERKKALKKGEEDRKNVQKQADEEALKYARKQAEEYAQSNKAYLEERNKYIKIGQAQAKKMASDASKAELKIRQNLLDDIERIENNSSKYMPNYLNQISSAKSALRSGNYNDSQIKTLLAQRYNDDSVLRGNMANLQNYITKGEKMLRTNYMPGELQLQLKQVIADMRELSQQSDISKASIDKLADSFRVVEMEAARAGKTFFGQVGQRLKDMNAKFIAQYFSIMDIIRYFRSMISTITELDTALTEMRKVSDESLTTLKEYQKTTFDTATALGTTAVQIQQSTADWMRLGESMEEAAKSAKAATTLLNVSEFENINDATTALVAMSQAYKDLDKTEIIDVLNNIGNNYSIATDQLATALQASSAALMTQGNDLYEAAALVTAGNAVIQDANKVGTGIRTISLRIAGEKMGKEELREELAELGEEVDDWVVQTEAKKRQVIMDYTRVASNGGQGVDILDSNGNLKDTYHIMLEISKIYKEIQEEDKRYGTNRAQALVEELAGKVRSNIAASILMNPDLLEDVYESAIDSAGSAAEENAKYLDSIIGKTQQFKNELQELEQNALDSELIKDVLDFGTELLDILNKVGDKLPTIIALVGSLAVAIASIKKWGGGGLLRADEKTGSIGLGNTDVLKAIRTGDIKSLLTSFQRPSASETSMLSLRDGLSNIYNGVDFKNEQLIMFYKTLDKDINFDAILEHMGNLDEETVRMAKHLKTQGVTSLEAFEQAERETGEAAKIASVGVDVLNIAVRALATAAITFAVTAIVKGLKNLAEASENATREAEEFISKFKEARDEIKSNGQFIDEISEEYDELSKGVDELGNNVSLSSDEFKRYNEIVGEISDRFPEMIKGWNDEKTAILETKDAVNLLNEAYKENSRQRLAKFIDDGELNKLEKSYKELKHANFAEMLTTLFTGSKEAGVAADYDNLKKYYEAIIDMSLDEYNRYVRGGEFGYNATTENQRALSETNLGVDFIGLSAYAEATEEEFKTAQLKAKAALDSMEAEMDAQLKGWRSAAQGLLEYNLLINDKEINSENRQAISSVLNSIDEEFIESIDGDTDKLMVHVNDLIDIYGDMNAETLKQVFKSLDENADYEEYKNNFNDAWTEIYNEFDEKIAQATTEDQKEKLKNARNELWEAVNGAGIYNYSTRFDDYLHDLASADSEYEELKKATDGFSKTQMELWYDVTNSEMSATQALHAYEEALKKTESHKFDNLGALLSSGLNADTQKSWAEVSEDLMDLAKVGKLDETTLKQYDYFDEILKELGISAEDADDAISGMIDTINKMSQQNAVDVLNNYKNGVDNLGDAYKKFKEGEFIDASTLSGLQDVFGNLDSYKEFEEAIMRGESDLQQYFDNIVTEYALQESALSELTEENQKWVKQQLIASGITEESADKSIKQALKNKQVIEGEIRATLEAMNAEVAKSEATKKLAVDTANLDKLTAQEIVLLMQETNASGESARAVATFALKKQLAKQQDLKNQDDLNYLLQLINLSEVGGQKVLALKRIIVESENANKALANFYSTNGTDMTKWTTAQINAYKSLVQNQEMTQRTLETNWQDYSTSAIDEINKEHPELDITANVDLDYGGIVDAASEAGSAAGESFKDALDKILAMYDAELDAGVVAFQTYVDKSRAIIEQYYNEGKITASEYNDYLSELYDKQIKEYDKVINAVQRRIKKEVDALEKQKEEVEESYNLQIEEIQKKIDALQEENDEIDKNMALSKAQYQLARAQHQRTRLMYSESRGFYYEADIQGISDAQEQVRKAQLDKTVSDLQKKITALQEDMKKETDTIDEQIKSLNEYSEAWGEVATTLQRSIEDMRAEEILGKNWEADILSERQGILEAFTNQYVELQNKQKLAYLAAREAEANNPVQAGGSGGSGGSGGGGGGTTVTDDDDPTKTETGTTPTQYWYNGKAYPSASQAQAQKQADVRNAGEAAYKEAYDSKYQEIQKQQKGAPESYRKSEAEKAGKEARQAAEAEINKRQIVAKFSGTDSAQPGETLVGELGSEIVLDKKSGTATIVDSPTIMDMKGGEKVFNAEETEKILKSKYVPLKQFNPKKFAMLHAFANGTSSPMQSAIAAQAVGIASGLNKGLIPTGNTPQTVNQTFNVSLPNITDASRAQDLFKEFESLQRRATQYFSR